MGYGDVYCQVSHYKVFIDCNEKGRVEIPCLFHLITNKLRV
jgi:transcriptional antiterminator Rof (Rho-off)